MGRRLSMVVFALAAGLGSVAPSMSQPAPMVTQNAPKRAKKGLFNGAVTPGSHAPRFGYGGPGTTAAQIKRASKKARNVAKHRGRK